MKFALVTIATLFAAANAASHPLSGYTTQEIVEMAENLHSEGLPENMSQDVVDAMVELTGYGADVDGEVDGGRRLGASRAVPNRDYGDDQVNKARKQVFSGYDRDTVRFGDDQAKVVKDGRTCLITFKESDSPRDWFGDGSNFDLGNDNMLSVSTVRSRGMCTEKCRWSWGRKRCRTKCESRKGYDGFVKPYKGMRRNLDRAISRACRGTDGRHYIGYSRGGGLAQIAAYMDIFEGKVNGAKCKLTTFGSPRALPDRESDELQAKLGSRAVRVVSGSDPVSGVPFAWMGYKHVAGKTIGCRGRDCAPWFQPWRIGDHANY